MHIIENGVLQREDVIRVAGNGVGRDLSMRAGIDQAPGDPDARAILLQTAFEDEIGAKLTLCLLRSLHAVLYQIPRGDQLKLSAISGLHQSRSHGLGQTASQGVCRGIVCYRFEGQNRHHPCIERLRLAAMPQPPSSETGDHQCRYRHRQPAPPVRRRRVPRVDRHRTGRQVGEVDAQIARRLVAFPGIFLQRAQDDPLQSFADLRIRHARRHWLLFKNRGNQTRSHSISERMLAGAHLIQHDPRRPQVRAFVWRVPFDLLRPHVRQRPRVRISFGQRSCLGHLGFGSQHVGQPEIEDLEPAIRRDLQVAGLQVAMNYPFFVRGFEAGGELLAQLKNLHLRQGTARQLGVKRHAGDILGDEVINSVVLPEIECHCDVRIGDPGKAQRFAAKLPLRRFGQQHLLGENLERHIAIQSLIARAKDHAHAARANLLDDAVMAKHTTNRGSRVRHSRILGWRITKVNVRETRRSPMFGRLFFSTIRKMER